MNQHRWPLATLLLAIAICTLPLLALAAPDGYHQLPGDVSPAVRTAIDGGDSTDVDTLAASSWDPKGNPNVAVLVGAATSGATVEVRFSKFHRASDGTYQLIGYEERTVTCDTGEQADFGSAEDYYLAEDLYFDPGPANRVAVSYGDPSSGAAAAVVTCFGLDSKGGE